MLEWDADLKIRHTDLYLDSRVCRRRCFISHAHSDHIACHHHTLATPATLELARFRLRHAEASGVQGEAREEGVEPRATALGFNSPYALDLDTNIELVPAGHVLGSAMVHVTRPEGTLLYTGDFAMRSSLTAEGSAPRKADHLVLETTYGLPQFTFPSRQLVIDQLLALVESAFRSNRQPIVLGYSLGKAQEMTRILTQAGYPVTLHGAPHGLACIYEQLGVPLGRFRRYRYEDFHGADAIDLRCRGVLIAPPHVARTPFVTRFKAPLTIVMTGWALLKGANYRYGVDHALPFSDHADFSELMELVDRVEPSHVYTHHGYTAEFAEHLQSLGIAARPATPPEQLALFD